ncbi:MAG: hypothetical protein KBT21_10615 [Treponema sp.]|nr:hypothetical protein [Candidatus Treponema merdequi]
MNFFNGVKNNIETNKNAEVQKKNNEAELAKKQKISAAKKQSMVNTLIMQRTPGGQ